MKGITAFRSLPEVFSKEKQFGSGDEQNCVMWGCREGRITSN